MSGFPHHIRARYVQNALTALRGRQSREEIAKAMGVAPVTLNAYSLEPSVKGSRMIPMQRLVHLMCLAEQALKEAQAEMSEMAQLAKSAA